jgi:hypothetical protein
MKRKMRRRVDGAEIRTNVQYNKIIHFEGGPLIVYLMVQKS